MNSPKIAVVEDFMSRNPIQVRLDMDLDLVGHLFTSNRLTAAPVIDSLNRILGVITDFMLVKMFIRKSIDKKDGTLQSYIKELDPILTISPKESLQDAFKMMLQSPNHRIFVIENNTLIGALSPKDLVPYLCGNKFNKKSINEELALALKQIQKLSSELAYTRKNLVSYQRFFDENPFMMHSLDWDGAVVMANKMLHFTLGYNFSELLGKKITDLYSHQNHKEAVTGLDTIKNIGFHGPISTLMVKKDKSILKVDVASMIRRDEGGNAIGTISISRLSDSSNMMEILSQASQMFNPGAAES
jgi:PAS domain S-box-containing protein